MARRTGATAGQGRLELKQSAKEVNAFLQGAAFLDALDATGRDPAARAAAIADPKKWMRQAKLAPPPRASVSLEERRSTARVIGFCVTVCVTRNGCTFCATVCVIIRAAL